MRSGAVLVRDGVIAEVGRAADIRVPVGAELIDLTGSVLIPGLVDAHCHLEWALMGDLVPPGPFGQWLAGFMQVRPRIREGDQARAARWAALTALRAGTTTMADSGPTGAGVAALTQAGLRGVVHLEVFGRDTGAAARERAREHAHTVAALLDASGPRVTVGVSPHAPYSVGPDLWWALRDDPSLGQRPFATHIAESPDEVRLLESGDGPIADLFAAAGMEPGRWPRGGPGPVSRLDGGKVLAEGLVAAHCVRVGAGDAAMLAMRDVRVAHCPQSNDRLSCGTAPVGMLEDAGVTVGLGTDSPASAGEYDLRAEARAAGLAATRLGRPRDAAGLLALATLGSARVLGMDHLVGAITPGRRADLVAVRPAPGVDPCDDPAAAVLDAAAEVVWVAVDGQVLLRDRTPTSVDPQRIQTDADEARQALR